jgi:hypothetical protein
MNLTAKPLEIPVDGRQSETALRIARGTARLLHAHGFCVVSELPLPSGRRADLVALDSGGEIWIVEIKSSVADFRADQKWPAYRDFADRLYFAVASGFPTVLIPEECGLMVADAFGAAVLREGGTVPLSPGRRRALTLRFARVAAARLRRTIDPDSNRLDGL